MSRSLDPTVRQIAGASLARRYPNVEPGDTITLKDGYGPDGDLRAKGGKYRVTKVTRRPYLKLDLEPA